MAKFLNFLFICLFSGAVVVIGARELHERFKFKYRPTWGASSDMIKDLHGDIDPLRARPNLSSNRLSETKKKAPEEAEESVDTDSLSRSDRRELTDLIDKIAP